MKREELLQQIAQLDEEINRTVVETELPKISTRRFPFGTWVFAMALFAWAEFGYRIPGAYMYHLETAKYAFYLGIIIGIVALLATVSWLLSGRGYQSKSDAYLTSSRKARDLQEQRRDLQAELRAISKE